MAFDAVDRPDAYSSIPLEQPGDERPQPVASVGAYSTHNSGEPAHPGFDGAAAVGYQAVQVGVDQAASAPVKRKRGRPPKNPGGPSTVVAAKNKKMEEEDEVVCFICYDGGSLVVCDRRGCPKLYHPACVGRDDAFFRTKGRWYCGWHICNKCEKSASYMCYTCTYSLCKQCITDASIVCVTENMGFCETCYGIIMLIESGGDANLEKADIDFDDKSSWHYLFKLYWLSLKEKLHLTLKELSNAKCQWKSSGVSACNEESYTGNGEQDESSDIYSVHCKCRKRNRMQSNKHVDIIPAKNEGNKIKHLLEECKWASPQLLEFTAYMRNGDISVLTQFDVQALLLEYIKRNNLYDPRRKSQIICDTMLQNLFHKQCVGHFEMLKLLESHFLIKEASRIGVGEKQENMNPNSGQVDAENHFCIDTSIGSHRKWNFHKKLEREAKNIDEYAAINAHNINLIYFRRNLLEDLIDDSNAFKEKVTGAFVRIRIPSAGQKQDMYRLVKIISTHVQAEKYKVGKKMTNVALDILNVDKVDKILMDRVSNQDFTEEECGHLRQSMKYGFINRLTVGDVLEKAKILQAVRVNNWLESEKLRLSHLRDRASETGRRKEFRECVEKLQLLSTPEERMRRLNDIPEIHVDAHMDESSEELDGNKEDDYKRLKEPFSCNKAKDLWSPSRGSISSYNWRDAKKSADTSLLSNTSISKEGFQGNLDIGDKVEKMAFWNDNQLPGKPERSCGQSPGSQPSPVNPGSLLSQVQSKINETDTVWHYLDPSGNIQGPFPIMQLRKWSTTGYFPPDLRIWLASQKQEDSILLSDALLKAEKVGKQEDLQRNNFTQSEHFSERVDTRQNHLNCTLKGNHSFKSVNINQNGTQSSKSQGGATPTAVNAVPIADRWAPLSATYVAPHGELLSTQSGNVDMHQRDRQSSSKDICSAVSVKDSGWNVPKQQSLSAKITPVVQSNEPVDSKRVTEACKASAAKSSYANPEGMKKVEWSSHSPTAAPKTSGWDISSPTPENSPMKTIASCDALMALKSSKAEASILAESAVSECAASKMLSKSRDPEKVEYVEFGQAIKDKNTNWESTAQDTSGVARGKRALQDENVKRCDKAGHVNMNTSSSCGTPTPGGTKLNSRWEAQPPRNMDNYDGWGQAKKDKVNTNWESTTQASEVAWEKPAIQDTNVKTGWDIPGHANMNANLSFGTPTPGGMKLNSGWEGQLRGNMNNYDGWGKAIKDKVNANWASTAQESGKVTWEKPALQNNNVKTRCDIPEYASMNANSSHGTPAPAPGRTTLDPGWEAQPQVRMNNHDGWGQAIKGKVNTNWEQMNGEAVWETSSLQDKNAKTGWDVPRHVNMNANSRAAPGKTNLNSGWEPQPRGSMNNYDGLGQVIKGKVNTNRESTAHENWETSLQGKKVNIGWDMPKDVNINANTSCGTPPAPGRANLNSGWEAQPRGSISSHDGWGVSAPGHSVSSGWGSAKEVKQNLSNWETTIQKNEKTNDSWGTWEVEKDKENTSWNKPDRQKNSNSSSNKIGGASMENAIRNSCPRNFDSPGRRRYDRDIYQEENSRDSRYRSQSRVGGGSSQQRQRDVCKFYASGHCKRGSTCKYLHR